MASIAVLLSGGVDSSVALHDLVEEGHDCIAFYLKVWLEDELSHLGRCPWEEDLRYARAVCESLSVPLEVVPFQRLYQERIVSELVRQLRSGRTPSPDVWCNRRVKFGAFLERVESSFDRVASGHYARLERYDDGRVGLRTAADPVKDQTYFLCQLTRSQLRRCRLPLGSLTKEEVRDRARRAGLPTAERPDSQGICFLGKLRYDEFVEAHLGEEPGPIVEAGSGEILGRHRGFWFYTLGQRRGLGLSGGPWYVVGKRVASNRVLVSREPLEKGSATDRFLLPDPHWILEPPEPGRYRVKVRHGPRFVDARLEARDGGSVQLLLDEPDPGLAPGQYGVVYHGDRCLGGGEMEVSRAVV
ncbi:MAG: tRNA 2-thiouridine(34) synthase MnmA [Thermoanaerobaculia bacterium]|nr:tRNA 2-thiouridine(34) synthase MnmA [Thermoanaerobaculia bacterium]